MLQYELNTFELSKYTHPDFLFVFLYPGHFKCFKLNQYNLSAYPIDLTQVTKQDGQYNYTDAVGSELSDFYLNVLSSQYFSSNSSNYFKYLSAYYLVATK